MNLRTRITLFVALGFVLLLIGLGISASVREAALNEREASIAIRRDKALLNEIIAGEVTKAKQTLEQLPPSEAFRAAGGNFQDRTLNRSAIEAVYRKVIAGKLGENGLFEVIAEDRDIEFSIGTITSRSILGAAALDRAFEGKPLSGLKLAVGTRMLAIATKTFSVPDVGKVVVVLGHDFKEGVERFARDIAGHSTLVSMRGRPTASSDRAFWDKTNANFSPREAYSGQFAIGAMTYSATSIPVEDISGNAAGALVSFVNVTTENKFPKQIRDWSIAGARSLVLLALIGLYWFLWRSFRPLEGAIGVLQALSRGDTSVSIVHGGNDEIGRIAMAVGALRGNVLALAETRRRQQRTRRRQETVVSRELRGLADSLDADGRQDILNLLDTNTEVDSGDSGLRQLARVLHDLAQKIVEQHDRLQDQVEELREALVTKTKLAGLQQELQIAAQVQLAILPKPLPPDPRIEVSGKMVPAREVGGDFYDFFMTDDNTLYFAIADVSGKGVPAAFFMAVTRTMLRSTAQFESDLSECVARLNNLLANDNDQMMFVTFFYGKIDLNSGMVTYVNAGHNLPYHVTADARVKAISGLGGMALAIVEDCEFPRHELQLQPGDTIFLYTDGVTEAFDIDETAYGEARLETVLARDAAFKPVSEVSQGVWEDVHVFERGAPPADDLTCVTLRYWGPDGAPKQ